MSEATADEANGPGVTGGRRRSRHRAPSPHRVLRRVLAAVLAVFLVWVIGGYFVIVRPKVDAVQHADAVLVLGLPATNDRFGEGWLLVEGGYASNLMVSAVSAKQEDIYKLCVSGIRNIIPGAKIICFQPHPGTTQGEAEYLGKLAKERGWKKIIIVTSTYHVARARMIFGRCFDGEILMVAARKGIGIRQWAYQYLYQTGAFIKAFVYRSC